jgi:putative peptidoglycan lipid II flippase
MVLHKMFRSTLTVSLMTLLSRITGLIRDIAFAQILGSGLVADAFFVAFRIPNFFRRIFAEGAFTAGFVPVYAEYESRYPAPQVRLFLDLMLGRLALILLLFTLLGVLGAPWLVAMIAPGFVEQADKYAATVSALRFTFPYLFFVSLVAMAGGILNARDRFAVPAVTPVLLNLCLIGAVIWAVPFATNKALTLGIGVFVAGMVQLGFQLPFLAFEKRLPVPKIRPGKDTQAIAADGVRRVFSLMLPAVFGVSVAQINLLINTVLASFLVTGSVSWLYYSDRLMEFPVGVFGIALATVILPKLATQISERAVEEYFQTIDWALRLVLLVVFPAAVALVALAYPLMVTLFQYGEFSVEDARMAARSLVAFSPGLIGFVLVKVLAPGFYARKDTKTPVRAGVIAMVVNALCAVILTKALLFGHVGLAAAVSISGIVNAGLLYRYMVRDSGYTSGPGMGGFVVKTAAAAIVMGVVLWFGVPDRQFWTVASLGGRLWQLVIWVPAGTVVYFGCLYLVGLKPHRLFQPQA